MSFLRSGVRVSLVFNFVCLLYRSQKLLAQHFSIKEKYLMADNKEHNMPHLLPLLLSACCEKQGVVIAPCFCIIQLQLPSNGILMMAQEQDQSYFQSSTINLFI